MSHILLTHDDFVPWLQENGQKQENIFFGQWAVCPLGKFSYDGCADAKDSDFKAEYTENLTGKGQGPGQGFFPAVSSLRPMFDRSL